MASAGDLGERGMVLEGGTSSSRADGERGAGIQWDEGAGRNQRGFSLRDFRGGRSEERRTAAPLCIVC